MTPAIVLLLAVIVLIAAARLLLPGDRRPSIPPEDGAAGSGETK